tara:strand:- start:1212 stop:1475 length:264 start_codon:yes stop_codon:yes gene_type:complete
MKQDEIIEMARDAGLYQDINVSFHQALRNFYDLAADKEQKKWQEQTVVEIHEALLEEREACAKVAEQSFGVIGSTIALAIRARGEQT